MASKPLLNNNKSSIKFLYSYGGKILPRHNDGKLRYQGGHTRVLVLHPSASFSELMEKLNDLCGSPVTLRCPLPNGDLDTLISVKNDEDLANIIEEYDRASSSLPHPLKIRAILWPPKKSSPPPSSSSSAAHSRSGSPHSSAHSMRCSPAPVAYPIPVRNGTAKGCWCMRHWNGNPRFLYRGPYWNNYFH
ncbi:hypothetical protein VNO78_23957 [Psophocarpus tetragonolobus]|uniref:PB1 domain-containing protein n=1 Tax=Psophocarpus tetragonolobus TaxID=3891 RepID=A0AAN9S446_PSOTE